MVIFLHKKRPTLFYRMLCACVAFAFALSVILPPAPVSAQLAPQTILNLPLPGTMVPVTNGFIPPLIKGITIHPENPLEFDFIVSTGEADLKGEAFKEEARKLIKYFLASLTVPEEDMWVNLSPYEQDRIIPEGFGDTEMGRDLLAQDYILKQLTASLMYPEDELGKKFWNRVYTMAYERFGTNEIPVNTFNKVWIVPAESVVYEKGASAFVVKSRLKVMLDSDYEAMKYENRRERTEDGGLMEDRASLQHQSSNLDLQSSIIKEIILPAIEKEVNAGETFAQLRQIYNSMILAAWYKKTLKDSLLGRVYVDRNKTKGVDTKDKQINQKIYDQYIESFKKGVYNYIKEDYDPATRETIPRKYFSGGITMSSSVKGSSSAASSLFKGFALSTLAIVTALPPSFGAQDVAGNTQEVKTILTEEGIKGTFTDNDLEEIEKEVQRTPFFPPFIIDIEPFEFSKEGITEKIIELAAGQFAVDEETITLATSYTDDLGADSWDVAALMGMFEFEFAVNIPDEEAEKMQTVGDTIEYIYQNQPSSSPVELEVQVGYLPAGWRIDNIQGRFYVDPEGRSPLHGIIMTSGKPGTLMVKKSGDRKYSEQIIYVQRSDNGEIEQFSEDILKIKKISAFPPRKTQFRTSSPVEKSLNRAAEALKKLKKIDNNFTEHRVVVQRELPPEEWEGVRKEFIRDGLSYIEVRRQNKYGNKRKKEYVIYVNDRMHRISGLRLLKFALERIPEKAWDIFGQDKKGDFLKLREEMRAEIFPGIAEALDERSMIQGEQTAAQEGPTETEEEKKIKEALRRGIREIKKSQNSAAVIERFKKETLGKENLTDDDFRNVFKVFLEMPLEDLDRDWGSEIIFRAIESVLSLDVSEFEIPVIVNKGTLTESGTKETRIYASLGEFIGDVKNGTIKNGDRLIVYRAEGEKKEIVFDQGDDDSLTENGLLFIGNGTFLEDAQIRSIVWSASSPVVEINGMVVNNDLKGDTRKIFNDLDHSGVFNKYEGLHKIRRQLEGMRKSRDPVYIIEADEFKEAVGADRAIAMANKDPGAVLYKKKRIDFRSWRNIPPLAEHLKGGAILKLSAGTSSPVRKGAEKTAIDRLVVADVDAKNIRSLIDFMVKTDMGSIAEERTWDILGKMAEQQLVDNNGETIRIVKELLENVNKPRQNTPFQPINKHAFLHAVLDAGAVNRENLKKVNDLYRRLKNHVLSPFNELTVFFNEIVRENADPAVLDVVLAFHDDALNAGASTDGVVENSLNHFVLGPLLNLWLAARHIQADNERTAQGIIEGLKVINEKYRFSGPGSRQTNDVQHGYDSYFSHLGADFWVPPTGQIDPVKSANTLVSSPVSERGNEGPELLKWMIGMIDNEIAGLESKKQSALETIGENPSVEEGEFGSFKNVSQELEKIREEISDLRGLKGHLLEEKQKAEQRLGHLKVASMFLTEKQAAEAVAKIEEIFGRSDDVYRNDEDKNLFARGHHIIYNKKVRDVLKVIQGLDTAHAAVKEIEAWLLEERHGALVMKEGDQIPLEFDPFEEGDLKKIKSAIKNAVSGVISGHGSSPVSVLILDDQRASQIAKSFEGLNIENIPVGEAVAVRSQEEGFKALEEHPGFNVLVLDFMLGDFSDNSKDNGIEFFREMVKRGYLEKHPGVRVIFQSSRPDALIQYIRELSRETPEDERFAKILTEMRLNRNMEIVVKEHIILPDKLESIMKEFMTDGQRKISSPIESEALWKEISGYELNTLLDKVLAVVKKEKGAFSLLNDVAVLTPTIQTLLGRVEKTRVFKSREDLRIWLSSQEVMWVKGEMDALVELVEEAREPEYSLPVDMDVKRGYWASRERTYEREKEEGKFDKTDMIKKTINQIQGLQNLFDGYVEVGYSDASKHTGILINRYKGELWYLRGKKLSEYKDFMISADGEEIIEESSSPVTAQGDEKKPGGINLNPELLDLQIRRDGNGVPLPLEMQPIENMHIQGFIPIIINVTPVSLPVLLGLADEEAPSDSAQESEKQAMDPGFAETYRNKFRRDDSLAYI